MKHIYFNNEQIFMNFIGGWLFKTYKMLLTVYLNQFHKNQIFEEEKKCCIERIKV